MCWAAAACVLPKKDYCRALNAFCFCSLRNHVAVIHQVQIHRVVRGGGIARGDGVSHTVVRADSFLDELFACYVDKAYRQKATAATCYIRQEGIYLPTFDTSLQPTFRKSFDDKQLYILCDTEKLTSDPAFLRSYISSLIKKVASV